MKRVISREDAKIVVNLLRQKQPRIFEDFRDALGMRAFEIKKLLKALEAEKVIIKESLSGEEKFWLNEAQGVDFLGMNPRQKKQLKHQKERKQEEETEPENPAYG